jgi:hypothetical protein
MADRKRGLTADERLAGLRRDRARLRRERMVRELGGTTWRAMVDIVPVLFRLQGTTAVRILRAEPLERLARAALIEAAPCLDTTLVRPWAGPPRLFACVVSELPPSRITAEGHRVVTADRLRRELIGAVGARADLFALLERAEKSGEAITT